LPDATASLEATGYGLMRRARSSRSQTLCDGVVAPAGDRDPAGDREPAARRRDLL
jgi:hypothetical protein